jgi:hypothetical protein
MPNTLSLRPARTQTVVQGRTDAVHSAGQVAP